MYTLNTAYEHQETQHHQSPIDDDVAGDGDTGGGESVDNPSVHIHYNHHHHGGAGVEDSVEVAAVGNGAEGVSHNSVFGPGLEMVVPVTGGGDTDQLTLSFQGEVYVFDAVSPEKVQAVLLLLGGYEVPADVPTVNVAPPSQRASSEFPGRLSQPEREASLNRFKEKRKERCFDKKIRYTVRKEVAIRMQRKKGQFTSSKLVTDETDTSVDWNAGSGHEEQETSCRHCGISSKSTPMMRRGPAGPRSLCNACGLKWANKGILRDLSKVTEAQDHTEKAAEQINGEPNGSDAMTAAGIITSNSGNAALASGHQ